MLACGRRKVRAKNAIGANPEMLAQLDQLRDKDRDSYQAVMEVMTAGDTKDTRIKPEDKEKFLGQLQALHREQ